jgi:hypothetical protein
MNEVYQVWQADCDTREGATAVHAGDADLAAEAYCSRHWSGNDYCESFEAIAVEDAKGVVTVFRVVVQMRPDFTAKRTSAQLDEDGGLKP